MPEAGAKTAGLRVGLTQVATLGLIGWLTSPKPSSLSPGVLPELHGRYFSPSRSLIPRVFVTLPSLTLNALPSARK